MLCSWQACYGVSKKVLQRWLQPHHIGQRNGHKYSLEQLLNFIEIIRLPLAPFL
jgi:hypothetical protein